MKKNKLKLLFLMLGLGSIIFISCSEDDLIASLDGIELSQESLLLNIDEVSVVTVSADLAGEAPEGTATEKLTWTSSDPSIAVVQANDAGLVASIQGLDLGVTTLTASNEAGNVMKNLNVEVIVKVESIELEEIPIASDTETSYTVLFTPEATTKKAITWTSSDPSVATVDANGQVTAVQAGANGAPVQAIITATSEEGGKTASVEITVSNDPPILGIIYCTVSGTGGYNSETINTTGADANIDYAGAQPAGNYEYYEGETLIVQPSGSFNISLTQSNNWSRSLIWVDWNGDNDFEDEGEQVQIFGAAAQLNDGPFSGTINVPGTALPGTVRMRILTGDAWTTSDDVIPCGEIANSSSKDINIEIGGIAYCAVSGTGGYNADAVSTSGGDTNISYSGGQPGGNYEHYTNENVSGIQGSSFNITLTQSNNWSMSVIWVDWNADGDFEDADELVQVLGVAAQLNDGPFNAQIDIPATAVQGNTRMRILTGDAWTTDSSINPCGEISNSTTKDFNLKVL